jgi:NDP-sugar pyrophosphorylase family protein
MNRGRHGGVYTARGLSFKKTRFLRRKRLMKAVIMAGGFGTRLRPLSCNIPKPMVYVANKPMMEYIINLLQKHGLKDLVVLLYFQAEAVRNYFGDGSGFGVRIEYVQAQEDYGTAGSVKNAESLLGERFLVISADVLTDIDLKAACDFHQRNEAKATMVLSQWKIPSPTVWCSPGRMAGYPGSWKNQPGERCSVTRSTPGYT